MLRQLQPTRIFPRLLLAVLILATGATAQAQMQPPEPFDGTFRAAYFYDGNEGWVGGDDGAIWHSIDGGKIWERQKTGTKASIRSFHFLTPYTGWAAGRLDTPTGSGGVLLGTTDGGLTWREILNSQLPGLNKVRGFDERTLVLCGDTNPSFPGGIFATNDGNSWRPRPGSPAIRWNDAVVTSDNDGIFVGANGQIGRMQNGRVAVDSIPGGRNLRAIASQGKLTVIVGDGGLAMMSTDGARWQPIELPLSPQARSACQFQAVQIYGERILIAGMPGSFILRSEDSSKTWQVAPTPITVAIHAITTISPMKSWAVGDFGTILGTSDGGATWSVLRVGGQRAAVLFAHSRAENLPAAWMAELGWEEGYLVAGLTGTSSDFANGDASLTMNEARLSAGVRAAGGIAAESCWAFPLPNHARDLSAEELFAFWDQSQGGQSREQMLRRMVLAVRTWRPDVIVTDSISPEAPAHEQIVRMAMQEAFKLAADPKAFPEQIESLHLRPHETQKLYGLCDSAEQAQVSYDTTVFLPEIANSARSASWNARRLLNTNDTDTIRLRLLSHRLQGSETHKQLMEGIPLARGGTARRAADNKVFTPEYVAIRKAAMENQAKYQQFLQKIDATKEIAFEKIIKEGDELLAAIPEDVAVQTLLDAGRRYASVGNWSMARELYQLCADRYFLQRPIEAYRWLAATPGSSEAIRRIERGELMYTRPLTFVQLPELPELAPKELAQVAFAEAVPAKTRVKFRSSEVERTWLNQAIEMQDRFYAVDPMESRLPVYQLAYNSARVRAGLTADAERALQVYHRFQSASPMGIDPWYDAVAAELWLSARPKGVACPKPLATAVKTAQRPRLDGVLDDACWKTAEVLPVAVGSPELAATHATQVRYCFDGEFLYCAIRCQHPEDQQKPKVTTRKRDENLGRFDRVEILLDLDRDYKTYYRFCVDQRGCVAEDCTGDRTWNPNWFVAVESKSDGWVAEIAIPVVELSSQPLRDRLVWAMNAQRVLPGKGVISWSGPADALPRPEGMALLEFRNMPKDEK